MSIDARPVGLPGVFGVVWYSGRVVYTSVVIDLVTPVRFPVVSIILAGVTSFIYHLLMSTKHLILLWSMNLS